MKNSDYIIFALPKGRLATDSMEIFERIGITCEELKGKSRKLIFTNEDLKMKFFLSKATDVPTYVEEGVCDIGIAGYDTLLEEKRDLYEVIDLGLGKCRVVVAGFPETKGVLETNKKIRVATKYPNIAKEYFNKKGQQVDIIKLNGSVELGPIVSLSDVIVDIVETGSTLKENGLVVLEEITEISARVVVNKVSMKLHNEKIIEIINNLKKELAKWVLI